MNSKLAKNRKKDEQNLVSICCKQSLKKYLNFDSVDRKIKIKQSCYYFFVEPGKKPMPFLSTWVVFHIGLVQKGVIILLSHSHTHKKENTSKIVQNGNQE